MISESTITTGAAKRANPFFCQTFISIISCTASVAALALIVIIFLRELPNALPPPITLTPNCSLNETTTTTTHQHFSTANVFLSCRKEIEWSPASMKKHVFENGTFHDTIVVGEFIKKNIFNFVFNKLLNIVCCFSLKYRYQNKIFN
jgi:hypothetical protein